MCIYNTDLNYIELKKKMANKDHCYEFKDMQKMIILFHRYCSGAFEHFLPTSEHISYYNLKSIFFFYMCHVNFNVRVHFINSCLMHELTSVLA